MAKNKTNVLQAALNAVPEQSNSGLAAAAGASNIVQKPKRQKKAPLEKRTRSDRKDTVMIGGHFPKSAKQQLRMIAAEENTTSQALLAEALNLLFVKKGKGKLL